jgi:hypothetical protein
MSFSKAPALAGQRDSLFRSPNQAPVPQSVPPASEHAGAQSRSSAASIAPRQGLSNAKKLAMVSVLATPFDALLMAVVSGAQTGLVRPEDITSICRTGGVVFTDGISGTTFQAGLVGTVVRDFSVAGITPALVIGSVAGFSYWMTWLPSISSDLPHTKPEAARTLASFGVGIGVAAASEVLNLLSAAVGSAIDAKPVTEICEVMASKAMFELSKSHSATAFIRMGAVGAAAVGLPLCVVGALVLAIGVARDHWHARCTATVPDQV